MKVVCDTSALIKLQKGEVIDCLGQLFDQILIPPVVQQECQDPQTKAALQKPFFKVYRVS